MVAFLGVIETIRPTLLDHNEFLDMLLGFAFLFGVGVEFVALALGIAGWVQRDRKRTFAVLGVVFSSATLSLLTLAVILSAE
ncbi:MAG: hypothetical protein L6Q99_05410 [Planctomycetes bacterium]|nr:hypothetical protein [Planctomycetota bacterium]